MSMDKIAGSLKQNIQWFFLILALVLLAIPMGLAYNNSRSDGEQLADNKVIVLLKPGADVESVLEALAANFSLVRQLDFNSTMPRTILILEPKGGESGPIAKAELDAQNVPEVQHVGLNRLRRSIQCPPNDPEYPNQWALPAQSYPDALCLAQSVQTPAITIIDTGITPVPGELDPSQIQQFNFYGGAQGDPETPFDTGTHGTRVASVAASTSNNASMMAGIANDGSAPVQITVCRTSIDGQWHADADIIAALGWCGNNQALRGGPGPINLSVNSDPPFTINSDPNMQFEAQLLQAQGDLVVNAAGNSGLQDSSTELYIRRVAGIQQDLTLWPSSVYGPFDGSGPADNILTNDGNQIVYSAGTSFAAPYWAGSIAWLISTGLVANAPTGDAVIESTATPASDGSGFVYPNLAAAVQSLGGGGAPRGGGSHHLHKGNHSLAGSGISR
jgi:hypothetical protein